MNHSEYKHNYLIFFSLSLNKSNELKFFSSLNFLASFLVKSLVCTIYSLYVLFYQTLGVWEKMKVFKQKIMSSVNQKIFLCKTIKLYCWISMNREVELFWKYTKTSGGIVYRNCSLGDSNVPKAFLPGKQMAEWNWSLNICRKRDLLLLCLRAFKHFMEYIFQKVINKLSWKLILVQRIKINICKLLILIFIKWVRSKKIILSHEIKNLSKLSLNVEQKKNFHLIFVDPFFKVLKQPILNAYL